MFMPPQRRQILLPGAIPNPASRRLLGCGLWLTGNLRDIHGTLVFNCTNNGNDGTLSNAPPTVGGSVGEALSFTAASTQQVTTAYSGFSGSGAVTLCARFNTTSASATSAGNPLLSGGTNAANQGFIVGTESGNVWVRQLGGNFIHTSTTWNDGKWHHLAIVIPASGTPSQETMYIDGVSQALTTGGTTAKNWGTTFNLAIGQQNVSGGPLYYTGQLQDIRVYTRALSVAEILDLYNNPCADYISPQDVLQRIVGVTSVSTFQPAWAVISRGVLGGGYPVV